MKPTTPETAERLILASASPQRRRLLEQMPIAFEVRPALLSEPALTQERCASDWARSLAYFKARCVAELVPDRWVLGADTVVECGGRVLGKPADADDAHRMLTLQMSQPADVITGLCLLRNEPGQRRRVIASAVTRVWLRNDPAARDVYVASGQWRSKAGAYGIQDQPTLVQRYAGSYSNVMGMPVELLRQLLESLGIAMPADAGTGAATRQTVN